MSDERTDLWISPDEATAGQTEAFPVEGGEVLVAPGQVAFFPDQPEVMRWKDAEGSMDHRPVSVGVHAECSCGWKADGSGLSGWTAHFISAGHK